MGGAELQGGLAPAPAAAASRICLLLAAKLEEVRSMQPGRVAPTRHPSGGDSSGGVLHNYMLKTSCWGLHARCPSRKAILFDATAAAAVPPDCRPVRCAAMVRHMRRCKCRSATLPRLLTTAAPCCRCPSCRSTPAAGRAGCQAGPHALLQPLAQGPAPLTAAPPTCTHTADGPGLGQK
jgi:hypothetical protein